MVGPQCGETRNVPVGVRGLARQKTHTVPNLSLPWKIREGPIRRAFYAIAIAVFIRLVSRSAQNRLGSYSFTRAGRCGCLGATPSIKDGRRLLLQVMCKLGPKCN